MESGDQVRIAVVGAGQFGRNHLRVLKELPGAELVAVVDSDPARAWEASKKFGVPACELQELAGKAEAAIVATPTSTHSAIGCQLLEMGLHILVEKPVAQTVEEAQRLSSAAEASGRMVQAGHIERFNPVIRALMAEITLPLFFEIHRMSVFSPRSLDVDVVLDLMVHDIDLVLRFVGALPDEVRAAGVSILSQKVDIANVRLAFPNGCVANLTASRVSTEKVRKMRLFQPRQYISVDYSKQEGVIFGVNENRQISMKRLGVVQQEPLRAELASFLDCVRTRKEPQVTLKQGIQALQVALGILDRIEEHSRTVRQTLAEHWNTEWRDPLTIPERT